MVNFKPVTRNQSKMRSFKTEYHAVINIIWEVKGESIWGSKREYNPNVIQCESLQMFRY